MNKAEASASKSSRGTPLAYKLRQLDRKINALRPEITNFRSSFTPTTAAGLTISNRLITNNFKTDSLFNETVIGDRYINHWLKFRIYCGSSFDQCRVTVYFTKRPGTVFVSTPTLANFVKIPDPAYVTVLYDHTFPAGNDNAGINAVGNVNLRKWQTIINRTSADQIEKGELVMTVQTIGTSASSYDGSYQLYFSNK